MRESKTHLTVFAVLAIVVATLAFKMSNSNKYFSSGSVYCSKYCPLGGQIPYKVDPAGLYTSPCGFSILTGVIQPYILTGDSRFSDCVATTAGTTFSMTSDLNR